MDDAYARFQHDLAAVGQRAPAYPPAMPAAAGYMPPHMPPPPHHTPVGGVPHMPPPPLHGVLPHTQQGIPPAGSAAGYYQQQQPQQQQQQQAGDSKEKKKKGVAREAGGKRWRDPTLDEWPENDFRIFVGDLGNDVNDDALAKAFAKYPSFAKSKIVKDKRTKKSKGFGFVSFLDSADGVKALKEMNGKYIGNRPVKLRKSNWEERNPSPPPHKKQKQQKQHQ